MTLPGRLRWGCCEGARIPAPSPEPDTGQNQSPALGARGGCLPVVRGCVGTCGVACVGAYVDTCVRTYVRACVRVRGRMGGLMHAWVRAWVQIPLHGGHTGLPPLPLPSPSLLF